MRVAETRAVNRALRKAYGIGLCSVEELGSISAPQEPFASMPPSNGHPESNGSNNGQPRLRDKLCLLIRKYELDPNLVKRYAADFCGTQELRDAGRDLIEAFVSTVAEEAAKDRAALVCKLNSYSQPEEVTVMKRHFPGLHVEPAQANEFLEGIFLVRVDRAYYRWHPQKPFFILSFTVMEPKDFASRKIAGRLYCTQKSLWKLNWFLRDFGYDPDLLGRDEVDEKALLGLTGILRTTRKSFAGRTFLNLEAFAPSSEWEFISKDAREGVVAGGSNDIQLHAD